MPPDNSSSPSSASHDRSVRWRAENQSRYFRKYSAPEEWEEEDDVDDEEEGEEAVEGEEGGKAGNGLKAHRVLALHAPNGEWIAAALYDPPTKTLHVLEDTKDTVEWDLAILMMEQWDPAMVITSSQAQDSMVDKVEEWCKQQGKLFELQPHKTFTPSHAVLRLSELELDAKQPALTVESSRLDQSSPVPNHSSDDEEELDRFAKYRQGDDEFAGMGKIRLGMVKLGCWVNVHAPRAISAAGGLMTFLSRRDALNSFDETTVPVDRIESMQIEQYMLINQDALQSLAVFDYRPPASSNNPKGKEAMSLFALFRSTVTPLGHKLLHTWHLRPLVNLDLIKARHDLVEIFSSGLNRDAGVMMTKAMKRIKNIPVHTKRLRRGRGGIKEWRAVVDALLAANEIKDQIVTMPGAKNSTIAHQVAGMISWEVREFQNDVLRTIDFDESKEVDRVCVRAGIDEELDSLREDFHELQSVLAAVAHHVKTTMDSRWPCQLEVQYFPSLGFLSCVNPIGAGFAVPQGWNILFSTEETFYYKTPETLRLDEEYGDIDTNIQARELVIVQELNERMKTVDGEIAKIMGVIAEVDCLLALARAAVAHNLVRPIMVEEPLLEIRHGRHILQEQFVERYIANDTVLCGGPDGSHHNMMIVTGANGSGKSAYGKQVALIAIMAQIGSFVPAESATIGVVDKIYTRMQTRESVSKAASAFMIDLSQVSLALRGATPRSLVILDEFGKGTLPADGAGLLAGVIEHLINGPCPRTIVLTHFHELFTQQFVDDSLPILHCHMKTELAEGTKELLYLYRLTPGKSLSSNAAECALAHGIPKEVVERGKEVSELLARFEIGRLHDKPLTRQDIKELRQSERLAKRFLEWQIDPDTQDVMMILKDMVETTLEEEADDEDDEDDDDGEREQGDEGGFEVIEEVSRDATSATIQVVDNDENDEGGEAGNQGQAAKPPIEQVTVVKQEPIDETVPHPNVVKSLKRRMTDEVSDDQPPTRPGYTSRGEWKGKAREIVA